MAPLFYAAKKKHTAERKNSEKKLKKVLTNAKESDILDRRSEKRASDHTEKNRKKSAKIFKKVLDKRKKV